MLTQFLRLKDRAHEIPPTGIFARSKNKLIPYIFTARTTCAGSLRPPPSFIGTNTIPYSGSATRCCSG